MLKRTSIIKQGTTQNEAQLQLEELSHVARLTIIGEIASDIAHEVNQPLAAISLFSQAGKRLLDSGQYERVAEVFDKLSQHAQRAGAIVERIQSMAKLHDTEKKSTDCYVLVTEVAQLAKAEASIHDIEIKVSVAKKLPSVVVDVVQVQQVILNLLRNSMQAMRKITRHNGNAVILRASLNSIGEVEIAVIDSGEGVSAKVEKKLFEPFLSAQESGMGLSLSRAIIQAHNGRINFHNNTICGATFYFTLPGAVRDD
jgi:two-component system sensor kinase FixL